MRHHIVATAVFAVGVAGAGSAMAQNIGIATSNPGSLYHNMGSAVASTANDAGLDTTIQPATSPNQYIPFVNGGGIEFGIANMQEVSYAYAGEEWFEGDENTSLRVVAMFQPLVEAIFVREDSGIMSVADLEGRPMVDGYTAQQTILPQLDAIYSTVGLTRDDMTPVNVPSVVAGADAFIAGEADGFIFAHGAGKVREADAAVGIRALGIDDPSDETLARAREHWPAAFFVELEAGAMPGVLEDTTYFAYDQIIFTHADAPDDAVRAMLEAIHGGKEQMASIFPPFNAFNPDDMMGNPRGVPFHPAAEAFYEEMGIAN